MTDTASPRAAAAARSMILPLALAQFIASYAATNMNVAISAIAKDLGTTVAGVQTAITLFALTMAALMIPGSKLTDIWGRKRCTHHRPGGLCGRRSAGAAVAGAAPADRRVLAARGRGLGADDPAHLHPGHRVLPGRQVAGAVFRRGQRGGRPGRGRRAADRWRGDQRDQLAGLVRPAGARGGLDHLARSQDQRPGPDRAEAAVRPDRGGLVGAGPVLRGARAAAVADLRLSQVAGGLHHRQHRGDPQRFDFTGVAARGHRRAVLVVVLPACPHQREKARTSCCRCGCSATRSPTWDWALRSCSG